VVEQVTTNSVTLSWEAATDNIGVTGYQVLRDGAVVGSTTALGYTDNGLRSNTHYSYQLRAMDAAGNLSAASPGKRAKTRNK
jgi:chitodextrinase